MFKVYSAKHGSRWFEEKTYEGQLAEYDNFYDAEEFIERETHENEKYHWKIVDTEKDKEVGYYTMLYDNFKINHRNIPMDDIRQSYGVSVEDWLAACKKWIESQNVLGE